MQAAMFLGLSAVAAADTCSLYEIADGSCGQSDLDCTYVKFAKAAEKGLADGTCAEQGYTVETGTQTKTYPIIGDIVVTTYDMATATASCSGSDDPVITEETCYRGAAGALGLKETVTVNLKTFGDGAGTLDYSGTGIEGFTCSGKTFTKSGQDIAFSDSTDCLPKGIVVSAVKYCSDSDVVKVTVKDKAVPLPITATLSKVSCGTTEFSACSGSDDPVITEKTCYRGSAGALGLTETVTVGLKTFADGAGTLDYSGTGIEAFTCAGKTFTKSGQDISFSDSSDCLPSGIEVSAVKYCSNSDTVKVTVKDKVVPLPITANLNKVACDATEFESSCTGTADPVITEETCYQGAAGALGLTETVTVNLKTYADGAGTLDYSGTGIEAFTCNGKTLTKSGQDIAFSDSTDCLPKGIVVSAVKYCSDSDTIKVTVKDKAVPLPISAILKKTACASVIEV